MRKIWYVFLFLLITGLVAAQESEDFRGSIPVDLLRPAKGEAPHYPLDTVIGEMGQGEATDAAFSFANWVAGGLITGRMTHPALEGINSVQRESYLSAIGNIEPRSYRIGGGQIEADGSSSFLVRFIGREYAITAEMYVKHVRASVLQDASSKETTINYEDNVFEENEKADIIAESGYWVLDELFLDEAKTREQEQKISSSNRMDYTPYERFF